MIRYIPNIVTLLNLLSGSIGIQVVVSDPCERNFFIACLCMYLGAVLDLLDGLVARMMNTFSELGKVLDSLADVVTFGLLPTFILIFLIKRTELNFRLAEFLPYTVVLSSALRLAKFNTQESKEKKVVDFVGLPTPASALIISSFVWIHLEHTSTQTGFINLLHPYFLLFISILMSYLMISKIQYLSLKKSDCKVSNQFKLLLVAGMILIVVLFKSYCGIPLLLYYTFLSIIHQKIINGFGCE